MPVKNVLNVTKVGFAGNTGDNRTPEDFAFPACMTSLMESLGENYPIKNFNEHNISYFMRTGNIEFIAASGIAFGFLWHEEYCLSCLDLMQVNEHNTTIKNAFDWAGYEYEIIEKAQDENNQEYIKNKIIKSIDDGIPVLAFGIIGPPECLIISGYDENGDVLIGWSHFQDFEPCSKESNGMFRKANWYENLWKVIIVGKKIGRKISNKDVLELGLSILKKTKSEGYIAGLAAYDEWIKYLLNSELDHASDDVLKARHDLHYKLTGNMAEARYWGGTFLDKIAQDTNNENIKEAALCFKNIHDLCWQVWSVLGDYRDQDLWKKFGDYQNRKRIAEIVKEIKSLDEKAIEYLTSALEEI